MKEKALAAVLTIVIVVFLIGTFYALAKSVLAIIGFFYVLNLAINLWSKSKKVAPDAKV